MGGTISQEELESWMTTQEHKARTALERRIEQLEKLNATLAAEVDRCRPVVEAAQVLARSLRRHQPENWSGTEEALERVVSTYEASMPK